MWLIFVAVVAGITFLLVASLTVKKCCSYGTKNKIPQNEAFKNSDTCPSTTVAINIVNDNSSPESEEIKGQNSHKDVEIYIVSTQETGEVKEEINLKDDDAVVNLTDIFESTFWKTKGSDSKDE